MVTRILCVAIINATQLKLREFPRIFCTVLLQKTEGFLIYVVDLSQISEISPFMKKLMTRKFSKNFIGNFHAESEIHSMLPKRLNAFL